jgi:subtilisin family serine protease
MSIDQQQSGKQGRAAGSAPRARRWYAPLRTVLLTWLTIAAAPILWTGIDSAVAMNFRGGGHSGFHGVGHRQTDRAPARGSRIGVTNRGDRGSHWGNRRLGSRIVVLPSPVGTNKPPRHPIWPQRPIVFGLPSGPSAPVGVANVAPPPPSGAGAATGGALPTVAAATDSRFVPDEVLVSFLGNVPPQAIVSFAQDQRLARLTIHRLPLINTVIYRFRITDRRQVPAVVGALQADRRIAAAQPNFLYALQNDGAPAQAVSDSMQYVVSKLHLPQAHGLATGDHVLVAVIDTGIDVQHPDLRGTVSGGFDAFTGDLAPHRHGTAMAGAIAAHGRLMGVAPAAHILAVRAFDGEEAGSHSTTTRILDALQWTVNSAARVVNMSFTGPADPAIQRMVAAARQKGMVLVAAAGNDGPQAPPDYPAAYPGVIAVTATDFDDHLLSVANHGAYIAVAAPGVDILAIAPNGGYGPTTGTSVATAHVSGLVALLLQRNPGLTPDAVRAIVMGTAKDLGPKGRDDEFGAGLVDAYAALLAVSPPTAVSTLTRTRE